jgi:hypothetical protein
MQIGIHSLPARRWGRIGLVALLGLALALVTVSAGHAKAGDAVVAKKKCKKKGKKSAAVAKKKKCKKKKHQTVVAPPPQVTPPAGPVVRADVTWTVSGGLDEADIDLHAFSNGAHTGYDWDTDEVVSEIPGVINEPGFESAHERIVDNTNPSTRGLTFAICSYYYAAADPADVTYHFVFANGSVQDGVVAMIPGDLKVIDPKEGGIIIKARDQWCPAPPP